MKLSLREFEDAVLSALKKLPKLLKNKMENIDVVVEEEASREILEDMGLRSPRHLLGLYQGIPFDRRGFYYGNVLPDKITLFKNPIESVCRNKDQVEKKVREVVIHEVGHYFGLDDERLEELENGDGGE